MKPKIKTFEDACKKLGIEPNLPVVENLPVKHQGATIAMYKLGVIAEALNEGWKPDYSDHNEWKYEPWWTVTSISKNGKTASGLSFDGADRWRTGTYVGSRLCFKSRELCEYAAEHFLDLYEEALMLAAD